jgi:hypothetical protein
MTYFFGDGFDLYALPGDAAAGYWDSAPNFSSCNLQQGRFSGSRAMNMGGAPAGTKTSGQNDITHHFTFAYMQTSNTTSSNTGFYITLLDGATAQCTVGMRGDGLIMLMSGTQTGAILATYAGPPAVLNVWVAYEIELVVHNTNGSITIRKNGNPNNDFLQVGLNTRVSANNYANKMSIGYYQNIGASIYIDDFLWRSENGTVPWSGDIRCYTRRPTSDVQAQLSRTTAAVTALMWSGVNVQQQYGANNAVYMQFMATYSGLLTGLVFPNSNGGTGRLKGAVFSSINDTIGTVLATSAELVNPAAGITLSFPTPTYITAGQSYWVGVVNDSGTVALNVVNSPAGCTKRLNATAVVYASWPVSNPIATSDPGNVPGVALIYTSQSNSDSVSEFYQDQTSNYVFSSTPGQNDLYTIGSIGATPFQVFGVTTRGYFEKSDSGTRNATVQLKSGGTTVQGPDTALVTATWGWIYRTDTVDPATGAAWTPTAVNGVNIGPRVTA